MCEAEAVGFLGEDQAGRAELVVKLVSAVGDELFRIGGYVIRFGR